MFTLGEVTGVHACCKPCGQQTVPTIKDYMCCMSKTVRELPCPQIAAAKVVDVVKGCYTAVQSCTCKGGAVQAAAERCSGKCCGGSCCGKKSCSKGCCGGKTCTSRPNGGAGTLSDLDYSMDPIERAASAKDAPVGAKSAQDLADDINLSDDVDALDSLDAINGATTEALLNVVAPAPPIIASGAYWNEHNWQNISPFAESRDPRTGARLVELQIPSSIADVVQEDVDTLTPATQTADEFRRAYCDKRIYPECDYCPYANRNTTDPGVDVTSLFKMIQEGIDALLFGSVTWAEQIFNCPGQLAALIRGNLGPIGDLVAPAAAGAVIGLTALRGALSAYGNSSRAFYGSDYRSDLERTLTGALRSGGCGNGKFRDLMNDVLNTMGVDTRDIVKSRGFGRGCGVRPASTRSRSVGCCSGRANRRKTSIVSNPGSNGEAGTTSKTPTNTTPVTKSDIAAGTEVVVKPGEASPLGLQMADSVDTDHPTVSPTITDGSSFVTNTTPTSDGKTTTERYGEIVRRQPSPAAQAAAAVVDTTIRALLDRPANSRPYSNSISRYTYTGVTGAKPTYIRSTDTIALPGKTYYIYVDGKPEKVSGTPGTDLSPFIARYGEVFEEVDPVIDTTKLPENNEPVQKTVTSTDVASGDEELFVKETVTTPDGEVTDYVSIGVPPKGANVLDYIKEKTGKDTVEVVYSRPKTDHDTASIDILSNALETGAPVVFNDGMILETPFFTDSAAYINDVVDTTKLITNQVVLASEMAGLQGIDMNVDEVKMAYILNAVNNNTEVPDDVQMEVIPTILDKIHDTYY